MGRADWAYPMDTRENHFEPPDRYSLENRLQEHYWEKVTKTPKSLFKL
jgi:hypothetical protein